MSAGAPVELLTNEQAAKYAAYNGAPSRRELERYFFLDDADRELLEGQRRPTTGWASRSS